MIPSPIQKLPYATNAEYPKLFPIFCSWKPAIICASPPKINPIATTGPNPSNPMLWNCNKSVVKPKPARPTAAGFAIFFSINFFIFSFLKVGKDISKSDQNKCALFFLFLFL